MRRLLGYWTNSERPMKEEVYQVSLFWYWLADQYGGIKFLDRLLSFAEHLGWERATQLAAVAGGAPDGATFDTLWRSFVLAMVEGKMPAGYKADAWFDPARLLWRDVRVQLDRGAQQQGLDTVGRLFTFYEPLALQPYSFTTVQLNMAGASAAELVVTGDSASVEAYLIKPGPSLGAALDDYALRPSHGKPAAVPFDPKTTGAPLAFGKPVRVEAKQGETALVLLMRLGDWGDGSYALELRPAAASTPSAQWRPLPQVARSDNSPASPPPLTAAELASLRAGTYLESMPAIHAEPIRQANVLEGDWGSTTALLNGQVVTLPMAPTSEGFGHDIFPAKAIIRLLGGSVTGNRFVLGGQWTVVTPGSFEMSSAEGTYMLNEPARMSGEELLVPGSLFTALGAMYTFDSAGLSGRRAGTAGCGRAIAYVKSPARLQGSAHCDGPPEANRHHAVFAWVPPNHAFVVWPPPCYPASSRTATQMEGSRCLIRQRP